MILLALLAAAQPAAPANDDIVVTAQRVRLMRFEVNERKHEGTLDHFRCKVTRTSGDAAIDAIPCSAGQDCMTQNLSTVKDLGHCTEVGTRQRITAMIAAKRAARAAQP